MKIIYSALISVVIGVISALIALLIPSHIRVSKTLDFSKNRDSIFVLLKKEQAGYPAYYHTPILQPNQLQKTTINNKNKTISMRTNIEKYCVEHIAIRALIDQYNDIVNTRNWKALTQIFAINSIWKATSPINMEFKGIDEISAKLPKSAERMEVLIQSTSGVVINVINNKEATVRSLLSEFGRAKENGEGFHAVCFYHDTVIVEEGDWKFKTRSLELKYFDKLPVPGDIGGYKY